MKRKWNYHDLFRAAREALRPVDGENADFTARQLVAAATDRTPAQLVADYPLMVFQRDISKTTELVERHLRGEPIAYILGKWDFHGLELTVTPAVLIPRDDTEVVTELAIREAIHLPQNCRVLDLCAGSGCIGLAVAARIKDARITMVEISPEAIRVLKKNIQDNHLSGRVSCLQLDVRQEPPRFLGKYDMIVSNPPYVTSEDMETLAPEVRDFEPHIALDGGPDGLEFYRAILQNYTPLLRPGGSICLEFGMGQEQDILRLLEQAGYTIGRLQRDTGERPRAVLAHRNDITTGEDE